MSSGSRVVSQSIIASVSKAAAKPHQASAVKDQPQRMAQKKNKAPWPAPPAGSAR